MTLPLELQVDILFALREKDETKLNKLMWGIGIIFPEEVSATSDQMRRMLAWMPDDVQHFWSGACTNPHCRAHTN